MRQKRCTACDQLFTVRPQVPNQTYCSSPKCQQARKRLWQRDKLRSDPDYQENQRAAQQAWARRNPDYWQHYRRGGQTQNPRTKHQPFSRQGYRNHIKMDVCRLPAGLYRITQRCETRKSTNNSWLVWVTPIRVRGMRKMDASRDDMIDIRTNRS